MTELWGTDCFVASLLAMTNDDVGFPGAAGGLMTGEAIHTPCQSLENKRYPADDGVSRVVSVWGKGVSIFG